MALPDLAPFKIPTADQHIDAVTWTDNLQAWVVCARLYLAASDDVFKKYLKESDSLPIFLKSFLQEQNRSLNRDRADPLEDELRQTSFLLLHRIWFSSNVPSSLMSFAFLSDVSIFYGSISTTSQMLAQVWKESNLDEANEYQEAKQQLFTQLEQKNKSTVDLSERLYQHVAIARLCSGYGRFLMVGSDLLDAICSAHRREGPEIQAKLATLAYFSLFSLFRDSEQKVSLLLDHLYSIRSDHQVETANTSLLHRLVTTTPLLYRLRHLAAMTETGRLTSMLQSLEAIGSPPPVKRKRAQRNKGKIIALDGVSMHKEAQISQIQELFPDLGSAFIATLLAEYADNVEEVTAALLEDSLPAHLVDADRSATLPPPSSAADDPLATALHALPPSSAPPARRNIFDNDDLDKLAVSTSQLHVGRRDDVGDERAVLGVAPNKAAILAALAAIDPDDDERDDTYDVEDVGGTIDATSDPQAVADDRATEELLFRAWKASPGSFGRDNATRRSQARASLRDQAAMTDEALEGWALMLERDQARIARLDAKYGAFAGNQRELGSSKWRAADAESGEDSDGVGGGRGGRGGGRGRGRGRGGNVAGAANDQGTQIARQRKDANKGSRANHSRRDGRAKKVARAGYVG